MANSEIDDIFSGRASSPSSTSLKKKGKAKVTSEPVASTSVSSTTTKKTKKRKRRQLVLGGATAPDANQSSSALARDDGGSDGDGDDKKKAKPKRPRVVETIQDPSTTIISAQAPKPEKIKAKMKTKPSKEGKVKDDVDRFRDSRGTGPRKRTEEGYLVYKEDELGMKDEGGDTPLCPFDCNCCF